MKNLHELAGEINNQESMARFVESLANDFKENRDKWVNKDLEEYLFAMSSWIEDMDRYYKKYRTVI